jgi:large subunit ribosomal protein L3
MGDERLTVRNLRVVEVDAARNLIVVEGAVPGATGSVVFLRPSKY